MNNLDRITQEIRHESREHADTVGLTQADLEEVIMALVLTEDDHAISKTNINQRFRTMIINAADKGA